MFLELKLQCDVSGSDFAPSSDKTKQQMPNWLVPELF